LREKGITLAKWGAGLFAAGLVWHFSGTCPMVKRIWTPSWVLGSGGLVLLMLAGAWWLTEIRGWRRWAFPLMVVGANSIVAYLLAHVFEQGLIAALNRHFGQATFQVLGTGMEPVLRGMAVLLVFWLGLFWMYRRKVFVKI
jgi:predicted acyltransferase